MRQKRDFVGDKGKSNYSNLTFFATVALGIRLKLGGYPLHSHGYLVSNFGEAPSSASGPPHPLKLKILTFILQPETGTL